jgi:formate hydrogenlyase subunit 3/multisubunit Na+/H+ antiporter MnhD subunit
MVILTGLLFFLGTFVSWNINRAQKGYFALYLLLNTGVMGVFLSLDFFPLLRILGSHAATHVFSNWHVGRTPA